MTLLLSTTLLFYGTQGVHGETDSDIKTSHQEKEKVENDQNLAENPSDISINQNNETILSAEENNSSSADDNRIEENRNPEKQEEKDNSGQDNRSLSSLGKLETLNIPINPENSSISTKSQLNEENNSSSADDNRIEENRNPEKQEEKDNSGQDNRSLSSENSEISPISDEFKLKQIPPEPIIEEKVDEDNEGSEIEEQPNSTPESRETETPTDSTLEEVQPSPAIPTPPPPESETVEEETPAEEPRVLVAEVLVTGADLQLERLVYNTVITQPGRTATRTQLENDVNAIYATGYFANVKVVPEDTPLGVRVTFSVEPNPILQEVIIETVPPSEEERVLPQEVVDNAFEEQYNQILNLRDLQQSIQSINEWYSQKGYDLAQIIGSPQITEDGIVKLVISEGIIENIQVRFFDAEDEQRDGGKTKDYIVTREMKLKPGDVFNRNTAQQDLQRVFGLGIFEDVRLSFSPGEDPSEVIVNVDVVEGNTGSVAAGAGISSTSGLFGTLSYQEQNLFGRRYILGTELQAGVRELLFDVNFTDPWIYGDPYRTSATVNAFRRRTISLVFDGDDSTIRTLNGFDSPRIVRTGGGVTFVRPIAEDVFSRPDWRLSAGFNYQRVQSENGDGDIAPISAPLNGFGPQPLTFSPSGRDDLFTFSFGASQDSRNNPLQPTRGSVLRLGVEQTVPIGSGGILLNRLRGSYSFYIPTDFIDFGFIEEGQPKPQAFAFNFQAGTVLGDLPPYEAFVVGGSNSVRGYAEGQVGSGRSYFQATAEYRFPILSIIGAAIFVDYGTLLSSDGAVPGQPSRVRQLPGSGLGYGLGLRIQSPVGPIRVDYGFNNEGGSRLSFGIGERF